MVQDNHLSLLAHHCLFCLVRKFAGHILLLPLLAPSFFLQAIQLHQLLPTELTHFLLFLHRLHQLANQLLFQLPFIGFCNQLLMLPHPLFFDPLELLLDLLASNLRVVSVGDNGDKEHRCLVGHCEILPMRMAIAVNENLASFPGGLGEHNGRCPLHVAVLDGCAIE